ncbi:MAG: transposase [Planctomycetota bacterium]
MKTIALDVHSEWSQLTAISEETGELLLELKVPTRAEDLRHVISGIPGRKRVIFEEGPMSGMLLDALQGVADEVISSDPTQNVLIATAEHSNDRLDSKRLAVLYRAGAIRSVYVPPEPFRTLRALTSYDVSVQQAITKVKNQIKATCRRQGVRFRGIRVYGGAHREEAIELMPNAAAKWQLSSLYRRLDALRLERVGARRILLRQAKAIGVIEKLRTIPGVGPIVALVLVAWIVEPLRFKSRRAISAYAGLGLGQGITNWQPTGRARASRRGQRQLKRVLFLAARAAIRTKDSALARRYRARLASGWEDRKAIRDVARCILFIARALWIMGKEYDDALVRVPQTSSGAR